MKLDRLLLDDAYAQEVKAFGLHLHQLLVDADEQDRDFSTKLKISGSAPKRIYEFSIRVSGHRWVISVETFELSPGKRRPGISVEIQNPNASGLAKSIKGFSASGSTNVHWKQPPTPELARDILLRLDQEHEVAD